MRITLLVKSWMGQLGTAPVMFLMLALSVASIAVILERAFFFARRSEDPWALARDLHAFLDGNDLVGARARMKASPAPEAAVLAAGLAHASRGAAAAAEAMAGATTSERLLLERRLAFLGTLGNNAPFIGLLGTVIGIVMAFDRLGEGGGAGRATVPTEVMSSIAEALVATALGLAVAIPAVIGFNYFQRRIRVFVGNADSLGRELLAYLHGSAAAAESEV
jgi:biopolymer transport protein ExbB